MENLNLFFIKIKELSFWQRIFSWSKIRSLSYDAFEEFKTMEKNMTELKTNLDKLKNDFTQITAKNDSLLEKVKDLDILEIKKEKDIEGLNSKIMQLNETITDLKNKLSLYESTKEDRGKEYENKIAQLNQLKENLEKERTRLSDERLKEKEEQFQNMKKMWSEHELAVKQSIKMICQNHFINYIDKVPFKGNPDNTIEICGQFIVFDAKSPSNDDLSNFPKYIKAQVENVKKYVEQENVKKEIFLVIPSNTINIINQFSYNMGDYDVYIITKDSLEPVILSLKKIEEYELADKLSPEERDNICRVIGKFAHTTKRKIQIDQFFTNQFIEILIKCKNDLPEEILKQVIEFEKAEKLNPPTEKRSKQILTKELVDINASINAEAQMRNIEIPENFDEIKKLE